MRLLKKKIKNIAQTSSGGTPSRNNPSFFTNGTIPWIKSGELNDGVVVDVEEKITEEAVKQSSAKKIANDTLMIALYGATVGKLGISGFNVAATNQAICSISIDTEILSKDYLFLYLLHKRKELVDLSFGGAQPNISQEIIRDLDIEFPERLDDQEALACDLQSQLARVETIHQAALKQKQAAKAMQSAVLREVFPWQAGESLPSGWRWEKIKTFSTVIRGASPRPKGSPYFFGGTVPRLMVADVTRDGMYVTPKIDSLTEEGAKRSRPMKAGSLVIQVSGNPGTPSILKIDCCIHDGFAGLIGVDENEYFIPYIYFYLETVKDISSKDASGGIWENLDTNKIRELSIPFPKTKREQEKIAKLVEDKLQGFKELAEKFDNQFNAIEALPAAILREAFIFEKTEM